ncbi:MAG: tetraacyldisaccharide 4'-kinase [Candidatus Kuenenia sp.]|nr:tetraacyldisaccharide 4'-kinase [Candidatus Kuenenia hertensis]
MSISSIRNYYLRVVREDLSGIVPETLRQILNLLSKIYGFSMKTRIFFYTKGIFKKNRLPVPVISVGNITTGGTGKTPVVEYLTKYVEKKGKRVVVISRGYASKIQQEKETATNEMCNDEYLLFKENIPGIVNILGKDRVKSGWEAINRHRAEYLLLDDGFQHLRLTRDLNIVLIDALEPFGYEHVLPRGFLREPLEGLRRADIFLLTHTDQISDEKKQVIIHRLHNIARNIPIIESIHKSVCLESESTEKSFNVTWLKGKKIFAFCAIGNPLSFRKSLQSLGAVLLGFREFSDHHAYTPSEVKILNEEAKCVAPDAFVVTQKDRVKLGKTTHGWAFPLLTLKMEICITKGNEILDTKLNKIMN